MNKKRNERELPGNTNAKQNGETVAEQEKAKNLTEQSVAETGLNNSEIRADGSIEADSSNESEKKQKKPRTKYASASYLAKMGLLSAAAALLLFIEFPIFPATAAANRCAPLPSLSMVKTAGPLACCVSTFI